MAKYVAFLRAINVGGHTVTMDRLRQLFEALRFSNVETFIASGNVIFDAVARSARTLEGTIEPALGEALGYPVATFIRTPAELARIAVYRPFSDAALDAEGNTLYVGFLIAALGQEGTRKLLSFASDVDELHVAGREVYWLRHGRVSDSTFSTALLERTLKLQATFRNARTVERIVSKYA